MSAPVCFMAFDVLTVGDKDLTEEPYRDRRRVLEEFDLNGSNWCTRGIHIGDGALFSATKKIRPEGVVAKRLNSRYRAGIRSQSWTRRSTSGLATSLCSAGAS